MQPPDPHLRDDEREPAAADLPDAGASPSDGRTILHLGSTPQARDRSPEPQGRGPAPKQPQPETAAPTHPEAATRPPGRLAHFARSGLTSIMTLLIFAVAIVAALVIWEYYITAPWTRDGRVRVQVASIAPQVSGQITEVRVSDNQFVHKGDVLYMIDPFDFETALASAKTQLRMRAADLQVKKVQAQRRQSLTDLAATVEEKQQYAGNATQAEAAFDAAQAQVFQADINLKRARVTSPVTGFVTNLLMRVGDYAHEGTTNISVIDANSYWIDGYFEETKMAHVCIGARAEAQLMGYADPIIGRVESVTRGISVSDAAPSTQGLPNVDPVYTWVRLAQRVPVRIRITDVPPGVPLVSGMTATVTIRDAQAPQDGDWLRRRLDGLRASLDDIVHRPHPSPACVPVNGLPGGVTSTLATPQPARGLSPGEINPGLAPGVDEPPQGP